MGLINMVSTTRARLYNFLAGKTAKSAEVNGELNQIMEAYNQMVVDVENINNTMDTVTGGASWTGETLADVKTGIDTVISVANNALSTAQNTEATALSAENAATTAVSTANSAVSTANSAVTTASEAQTVANTALSTANAVQADYNTQKPIILQAVADANQAVNAVAGKADMEYVDNVAANFAQGVIPNGSLLEEKLQQAVVEKLNLFRRLATGVYKTTVNNITDRNIAQTGSNHHITVKLPNLDVLNLILLEQTSAIQFTLKFDIVQHPDIGIPYTQELVCMLMLFSMDQDVFAGSLDCAHSEYLGMPNPYSGVSGHLYTIGTDRETYLDICLTINASCTAPTVLLKTVEAVHNKELLGDLSFTNTWDISTKADNSEGLDPGTYTALIYSIMSDFTPYLPNPVIPPSYKQIGSGMLSSTTGTVVALDNPVSSEFEYSVYVCITSNPAGYLGEVWVQKGTTSFTVFCSGSTTTTTFDFIVF